MTISDIGLINSRRLRTPGAANWKKSVRADDPDRHLLITIDSHVSEPEDVYKQGGLDRKYWDRTPRMILDDEGRQFIVAEGLGRPFLVKGAPKRNGHRGAMGTRRREEFVHHVERPHGAGRSGAAECRRHEAGG